MSGLLLDSGPGALWSLAYLSTLICVLFSARITAVFLRESPRLFTVMILFTCGWLILLGSYADNAETPSALAKKLADRNADLAAILFIYAGGALVLEARHRRGDPAAVTWAQANALNKMIFLAVPLGVLAGDVGVQVWGMGAHQLKLILSTSGYIVGFVSLGLGVHALTQSRIVSSLFWTVALTYSILCVASAIDSWQPSLASAQTSPVMVLAYAYEKLLLTIVFSCIVAYYGMPSALRARGPMNWAKLLLGSLPASEAKAGQVKSA